MTKKISTPRYPLGKYPIWKAIIAKTAIALRPSISLRYIGLDVNLIIVQE